MNDLVRLPPPGDPAGFEQWRQDYIILEQQALSDRAQRDSHNFLWMLLAGIVLLGVQIPQFADLLRLRLPPIAALEQISVALQLGALVAIAVAVFSHWRLRRARIRDSRRMLELYKASLALEAELDRG